MKIENNGIAPLTPKPTDLTNRVEKKDGRKDTQVVHSSQDKAVMSDGARLLVKARTALSNVDDSSDDDRLMALKQQIANGEYTIKMNDLAAKLVAKYYSTER